MRLQQIITTNILTNCRRFLQLFFVKTNDKKHFSMDEIFGLGFLILEGARTLSFQNFI